MATKTKKKDKVDIFSLYKQEKIVTLEDDAGNKVKILFVKPTQGERQKLLERYIDVLAETREQYFEKDRKTQHYTKTVNSLSKKQLIEGIMNYQRGQRSELLDLYPLPDEENLDDKKREDLQVEIIEKWEKNRTEDLNKMTISDLRKELANITLEGLSIIESGKKFDFLSLQTMCLDPETREHIFKTPEDVEKVRDRRIIDTLLEALAEFRSVENMQEVRKASEDSDFLTTGESPKS